jgi:hypothetical protein
MDTKKFHIQFDKENKYIGKVDPTHEIIAGHYNVEVSHDEHEDIEKNKENADHVASIIGNKEKIAPKNEGLEPATLANKSFTFSGITHYAKGHQVNAPGIVDDITHGEIDSVKRDSITGKPVYSVKYNLPKGHPMTNDPETGDPSDRTTYNGLWHHDELMKHNKPISEATYPLFGDSDLDTVNQKIKKHGRNPDTVKQGETVHVFTHRGEHGFAQVHYDPSLDKYKVLGKSNVKKGVHAKYFDKDSDAHAHAKDWVKNPIHEMVDELMEISKQKLANYIKDASYDVLRRSSDKATAASKQSAAIMSGNQEREEEGSKERGEIHDKMLKRTSGINKAASKLTKEDLDEGKFDLISMANDHKKIADAAKEKMYSARDKEERDEHQYDYNFNMSQHHALMYKHHSENGDESSANLHKKEHSNFTRKTMNESFGAQILDSIINNKPIQSQEQFGLAMANVIKTKIDDMRQEMSKEMFNHVNELDTDTYKSYQQKAFGGADLQDAVKRAKAGGAKLSRNAVERGQHRDLKNHINASDEIVNAVHDRMKEVFGVPFDKHDDMHLKAANQIHKRISGE